ncbi:hypothetical protein ACXJJ3_08855 [Kribbella sp. WER1]
MTGTRKDGSAPVHRWVKFPNPYMRCSRCGQPVRHWHDEQQCGTPAEPCDVDWYLAPCGHQAEAQSACKTWNPLAGCQCFQTFGNVPHENGAVVK